MLGNKWLIDSPGVSIMLMFVSFQLTYSMLLQTKKTYIYTVVSSWNIQRILFHYADNIETPKFLLYLRHSIFTMPCEHNYIWCSTVSMVTMYTISKLYTPAIFFSWFTIANQMTLNLTFLGVLKRLHTHEYLASEVTMMNTI